MSVPGHDIQVSFQIKRRMAVAELHEPLQILHHRAFLVFLNLETAFFR